MTHFLIRGVFYYQPPKMFSHFHAQHSVKKASIISIYFSVETKARPFFEKKQRQTKGNANHLSNLPGGMKNSKLWAKINVFAIISISWSGDSQSHFDANIHPPPLSEIMGTQRKRAVRGQHFLFSFSRSSRHRLNT